MSFDMPNDVEPDQAGYEAWCAERDAKTIADLLAAMKFAFLNTRGVIGLDNDQNARLCEARDRLNCAMTSAGFDWNERAPKRAEGAVSA